MSTDNELAIQALSDPNAFGELIMRYEGKLSRYIARYIPYDDAQVEDVLQEVFILAYKNIASYNSDLSWSSWLYRVTRNYTISTLRKNNIKNTISTQGDTDIFENIADDIDIAEEQGTVDLHNSIYRSIYALSDVYRDTLFLYYFEQKSYDEISDILRKPPGTVATYLSRAKKQLKKILLSQNISR